MKLNIKLIKEILHGGRRKGRRSRYQGRSWEAWDRYEAHCRSRFWWYKWCMRAGSTWDWIKHYFYKKPSDAIWWLRYRLPPHRYHVIKPKSLKPGYHDQHTQLLHAAFHCIVSYVEENVHHSFKKNKLKMSALQSMTRKEIINHFFALQGDYKDPDFIAGLRTGDNPVFPFDQFGAIDRAIVDHYIWWTRVYPQDPWMGEPEKPKRPTMGEMFNHKEDYREKYPEYVAWMNRVTERERRAEQEEKKRLIQIAVLYRHLSI
jgi:hypothetical protein